MISDSEEITGKIVNILAYQAVITAQGESYTGEKDWALNKLIELFHQQLQKAREEVINSVTITVLNSRTLEESTGIGVRESTARAQVCVDIRTKLLDHSELDQDKQ